MWKKMTKDIRAIRKFSHLYAYLNGDLDGLLHVISSNRDIAIEFKRRITDGRYMRERYIDEDMSYMAEHDFEIGRIMDYVRKYVYSDQELFFQFMDDVVKGGLLDMVKERYF
jgi:hypothetical protein